MRKREREREISSLIITDGMLLMLVTVSAAEYCVYKPTDSTLIAIPSVQN